MRPTLELHRLTSLVRTEDDFDYVEPSRLVDSYESMDQAIRPRDHKEYDGPRISLPRDWSVPAVPATSVLAGTDVPAGELDLAGLGRILFLSSGVTRVGEKEGMTFLFRAAGSAGARFPLETYVAVPAGGPLPEGVHWYHPLEHALVQIGPPPAGGAVTVAVTGVPWRTGWKYGERGYRHLYWDAGTMLSQLLAAADSGGVPARLFTRFPDASVEGLLGVDGVQEFPLALAALGPGDPVTSGTAPTSPGMLDEDAVEFPLVTAARRASLSDDLGRELPRGEPVAPGPGSAPLDDVVLERGSTRNLDPAGSVPLEALRQMMQAAMRGIDIPHWLGVNAVDGLEPGIRTWPGLQPVRSGPVRDVLADLALGQALPGEAAFVAISAAPLADVDDRAYGELQLQAGLVEGRLHLMAYALGFGATGMTFCDEDIPGLVGTPGVSGLLWTCVGVPAYKSRKGGRPGQATPLTGAQVPRMAGEDPAV